MKAAYILSELHNNNNEIKGGELSLSHVRVNDIKRGEAVEESANWTIKGHKCIIFLLTSTEDQNLNTEILRFNDLLSKTLNNTLGLYIYDHKNLSRGK